MIKELKLTNFRKFEKLSLIFNERVTIIYSDNAVGKSTILEAIHIITNQFSPFSSDNNEIYNIWQEEPDSHFRIEVRNKLDDDEEQLAHFQDRKSRQYFRNRAKTTRKKLTENVASVIFSPEQIEILMLSPDRRRDFIDEVIARLDPDYQDNLKILRRTLKQRNSQLKKLSKIFYESGIVRENDQQLAYWTKQFAHISSQVMQKRAETIDLLCNDLQKLIYLPSVSINILSDMVKYTELVELHLEQLQTSTKRDIAVGHSTVGAHRDDWKIMAISNEKNGVDHSQAKDVRKFGSRGEKRMAVGRLILTSHTLLQEKLGFAPTLLLDDISSELDQGNTVKILQDAISRGAQLIITTIHLEEIPEEIRDQAEVLNLSELLRD
ncbi:MAG: DNA replication and repair protein RecF [Candidatus Dojkabacteria bacterium]|nr:MAG: DNA replication and repair protein RecF [Candidatus Dojkabacteria bacterium]